MSAVWPKAVVAVAAVMLVCESSAGRLGSRALGALVAPQSLATRYGLSVVELPPAPLAVSHDNAQGCPIELRAAVVADLAKDSFAVVAIAGRSAVLGEGESVRTPAGWVAVSRVAADHALVRKGGVTYRCALGNQP